MTPAQFKAAYETARPTSNYFTRESMKFFGDTMANYKIIDHGDRWELARKRPVKEKNQASTFFEKVTFDRSSEPEGFAHPAAPPCSAN